MDRRSRTDLSLDLGVCDDDSDTNLPLLYWDCEESPSALTKLRTPKPVLSGKHGHVDIGKAGREDHDNGESRRELPPRKRKPFRLEPLAGGPIVLLGILLVPRQPPSVPRQISQSRHVQIAPALIRR
ncbi:hypothetical protein ACFX13_035128 [Malus domestica]